MFSSFQNLERFVQHVHLYGRLRWIVLLFPCEILYVAFQQILAKEAIKIWGEVSTEIQLLSLARKALRVSQGALKANGDCKPTIGNNKSHESKNVCSLKQVLRIKIA